VLRLQGGLQAVTVWSIDAVASKFPKRIELPFGTVGGFWKSSDRAMSPGM
jgi:hypothetical protein